METPAPVSIRIRSDDQTIWWEPAGLHSLPLLRLLLHLLVQKPLMRTHQVPVSVRIHLAGRACSEMLLQRRNRHPPLWCHLMRLHPPQALVRTPSAPQTLLVAVQLMVLLR
jgi:hypothetical protein